MLPVDSLSSNLSIQRRHNDWKRSEGGSITSRGRDSGKHCWIWFWDTPLPPPTKKWRWNFAFPLNYSASKRKGATRLRLLFIPAPESSKSKLNVPFREEWSQYCKGLLQKLQGISIPKRIEGFLIFASWRLWSKNAWIRSFASKIKNQNNSS